jgi:hypothetical protein
MSSLLLASQSGVVLWVVATGGILGGTFLGWVALTDRYRVFSDWYEENKDSRIGFWAISGNAKQFRMWFVVLGVGCVAAGVAALVVAI